jgi:hypothetical protein
LDIKGNYSDESEDTNIDRNDSDGSGSEGKDAQAKETKPLGSTIAVAAVPKRKAPVTANAAVTKEAVIPIPSSGVDTNAFAKVMADDTRIKTIIKTKTVLTTTGTPSVHAVTAAAAMAMSNSMSKPWRLSRGCRSDWTRL